MNDNQLPSVEMVQGNPHEAPLRPQRGYRLKVFFGVLLLSVAVGLAWVYSRDPVYRAAASVLTVKPKAVDTRSAEADTEHVAIQGRLLLGEDLLGRLADRLREQPAADGLDAARLPQMLSVQPVPETNLLELRATGEAPAQLQLLVDQWAATYEIFRAEQIEAATGRTTAELREQQSELDRRIDTARAELEAFREEHEIIGLARDENRSMAELKGLNESLNKARDRLIEARARKIAVDAAVADGDTVVPSEQKAEITKLRLEVQRKRVQLADLRRKYTERYIERDPELRRLPGELRNFERELAQALDIARITVSDEAQQDVEAARIAVATIEQRITDHQQAVQTFNTHYKQFQALEANLERLEKLRADTAERLTQIQVSNFRKYPQIQVVEWARLPDRPISPDYMRDTWIVLGGALALALFVTWLVEYLSGRGSGAGTPMVGVRVYAGERSLQASNGRDARLVAAPPDERIGHAPRPAIAQDTPTSAATPGLPRELTGSEVKSLLAVCAEDTALAASWLLSGISPYELPLLHPSSLDQGDGVIRVSGTSARDLTLADSVWRRARDPAALPDPSRLAPPVAELDQQLRQAAGLAPLHDPATVNALALWHTYVVFLVRQGADPEALQARVGALPDAVLDALTPFEPPSGHRPPEAIDLVYPALAI